MKRTWIFFKLRLLQLKSDKTALFFSYIFPVLLLIGIGLPMEMRGDHQAELYYEDLVANEQSQRLISYLEEHALIKFMIYKDKELTVFDAIEKNEVKHFLSIVSTKRSDNDTGIEYHLYRNTLDENHIETEAINSVIGQFFQPVQSVVKDNEVKSEHYTSYLAILLPGLIGMTLLLIGLNGFGGVLIEEKHYGLFKNIKTIDVSPVPFLGGLFLSRLLVSYTVAIALFFISVFVFDITAQVNYLLLALVVTLGCVAFLGIGLVITTISPSVSAFSGIVNFVQMPFIVLGGVFFSITTFPEWLQVIAKMIPLTQMNTAMQKLMFESVGFHNISMISIELMVLILWCVGTLLFARMKFSW